MRALTSTVEELVIPNSDCTSYFLSALCVIVVSPGSSLPNKGQYWPSVVPVNNGRYVRTNPTNREEGIVVSGRSHLLSLLAIDNF